jgi:hypothetical protein
MPTVIELTTRLDNTIRGIPLAIDGISGVVSPYNPATVRVSPGNLQSQAQPIIDGFDGSQNAQDEWKLAQEQSGAITFMSNFDRNSMSYRAAISVAIDEINVLRDWITAFKAAVAAATNLANLQSRIAALPDTPDRTFQQAKNAFITKIQGD